MVVFSTSFGPQLQRRRASRSLRVNAAEVSERRCKRAERPAEGSALRGKERGGKERKGAETL